MERVEGDPEHLETGGWYVHKLTVFAEEKIGGSLIYSCLLHFEGRHKLPAREQWWKILNLEPERENIARGMLTKDKSLSAWNLICIFLDSNREEIVMMVWK